MGMCPVCFPSKAVYFYQYYWWDASSVLLPTLYSLCTPPSLSERLTYTQTIIYYLIHNYGRLTINLTACQWEEASGESQTSSLKKNIINCHKLSLISLQANIKLYNFEMSWRPPTYSTTTELCARTCREYVQLSINSLEAMKC